MLFINLNFKMTCVVEIDLIDPSKETRSATSGNSAFDLKYRVSRYFRMNICYFEEFRILLKISEETNKDIKRSLISFIKSGVPIFFPINLILINIYICPLRTYTIFALMSFGPQITAACNKLFTLGYSNQNKRYPLMSTSPLISAAPLNAALIGIASIFY